jgi:hypothetical protein
MEDQEETNNSTYMEDQEETDNSTYMEDQEETELPPSLSEFQLEPPATNNYELFFKQQLEGIPSKFRRVALPWPNDKIVDMNDFQESLKAQRKWDILAKDKTIRILTQNMHFRPTYLVKLAKNLFDFSPEQEKELKSNLPPSLQKESFWERFFTIDGICTGSMNFQNVQEMRACVFTQGISELGPEERPHIICIQEATDDYANAKLYSGLRSLGYVGVIQEELEQALPSTKIQIPKAGLFLNPPGLAIFVDKGYEIVTSDSFVFQLMKNKFYNESMKKYHKLAANAGADFMGHKGLLFALVRTPDGNFIGVTVCHPSPYVKLSGQLGTKDFSTIAAIHRNQLYEIETYHTQLLSGLSDENLRKFHPGDVVKQVPGRLGATRVGQPKAINEFAEALEGLKVCYRNKMLTPERRYQIIKKIAEEREAARRELKLGGGVGYSTGRLRRERMQEEEEEGLRREKREQDEEEWEEEGTPDEETSDEEEEIMMMEEGITEEDIMNELENVDLLPKFDRLFSFGGGVTRSLPKGYDEIAFETNPMTMEEQELAITELQMAQASLQEMMGGIYNEEIPEEEIKERVMMQRKEKQQKRLATQLGPYYNSATSQITDRDLKYRREFFVEKKGKLSGLFITGDLNTNRYAGEPETSFEKSVWSGSVCCSAEYYNMLRRLSADQPPLVPDPNEGRFVTYNNDPTSKRFRQEATENDKNVIKLPPGWGGQFTWEAGVNAITQDPLWPASWSYIDYVLYFHGWNAFNDCFVNDDPVPLYMDNRPFRIKAKEPFPEISKFYDKACVDNRRNIILNPFTSMEDKEKYYKMNLAIEENKLKNKATPYKGYSGYEICTGKENINCESGNCKRENFCCKFTDSQTDLPRFGEMAKTLPPGSDNPFKMIQDISDHYGVMSFILLDTEENQRFQEDALATILQGRQIEFPAQVPMIHARRIANLENPYDLYRYSRIWQKMRLLSLPQDELEALKAVIAQDLAQAIQTAKMACRQSRYDEINVYRKQLRDKIPSLREETQQRKKEYKILKDLEQMLKTESRDTSRAIYDITTKAANLLASYASTAKSTLGWGSYALSLLGIGAGAGLSWPLMMAIGVPSSLLYAWQNQTINDKLDEWKDLAIETVIAK